MITNIQVAYIFLGIGAISALVLVAKAMKDPKGYKEQFGYDAISEQNEVKSE